MSSATLVSSASLSLQPTPSLPRRLISGPLRRDLGFTAGKTRFSPHFYPQRSPQTHTTPTQWPVLHIFNGAPRGGGLRGLDRGATASCSFPPTAFCCSCCGCCCSPLPLSRKEQPLPARVSLRPLCGMPSRACRASNGGRHRPSPAASSPGAACRARRQEQ